MKVVDRIIAAITGASNGGRKGWSEPPFWQSDLTRPFLSALPMRPDREVIEHDLTGYIAGALKENGVVYACIQARQLIFSEARFQWRAFVDGRPGELFDSPELELLARPWSNGTTGELLARMDVMASLAGNFYATTADDAGNLGKRATGPGRRIVVIPPDRVSIVLHARSGNPHDLDARVAGYLYEPRAANGLAPAEPVLLLPDEVCHYSPIPDPQARFRGMSWITPIIREITADKAATKHKGKFFENGATPNLVVSLKESVTHEQFKKFISTMDEAHKGVDNAYKTLYLGGGADVTVAGKDLRQLDFKQVQGHGETRIAAAAGVPPVIVGLSEGLQSATYSNYAQARRRFADGTIRPLWRMAAASLETLVTPPAGATLWYDDRDIAFLREDQRDAAGILKEQMLAIESGIRGGFQPSAVVDAVTSGDLTRLEHTGLFSVQLQPPTSGAPSIEPPTQE